MHWKRLDLNHKFKTLARLYFGLLLGFLMGHLFWIVLEPTFTSYFEVGKGVLQTGRLFIILFSGFVSVVTLLQTKAQFPFATPSMELSKRPKGSRALVLDTSAIIDGRIADICATGIIDTTLIVPRFVLQELQTVADSSDKIKRNRGRRGLDVLKGMQSNSKIDLQIQEVNLPEFREVHKVDERLVILARSLGARVVTNDYNLNKISQLQGVEVINLNELANALKSVALPGETLSVCIVKEGDQIGQGVGFLDDGTMVVVEHGRSAIGQEVNITVTNSLQNAAGRIIFGKIEGKPSRPGSEPTDGPEYSGEKPEIKPGKLVPSTGRAT